MLFSRSNSKLGIDIGTSSIKVVQLQEKDKNFILETYGVVSISHRVGLKEGFDAITETAQIIKELISQSGVTAKKVVASLPNNIVFVTMMSMPEMSDKDLKQAIEWEAKRYVPLPLEEVTLSWSALRDDVPGLEPDNKKNQEGKKIKVLLTAVPSTVIENYLRMFRIVGLEPEALEIEALALIRSLIGPGKGSFIIVDIGAKTTSLNLVSDGYLQVSRNLSVGGETITAGISQSMQVSMARAEKFKRDLGLTKDLTQHIPQAMRPATDTIKNEITQLIKIFESNEKSLSELIIAGSGSHIPGLVKYFSDLGPKVSVGDPLKFISYDSRIREHLNKQALALSVAIGLTMRE